MKNFILLLLLATLTAQAATFTGKVVGVSDGDTITVLAAGNKQQVIDNPPWIAVATMLVRPL